MRMFFFYFDSIRFNSINFNYCNTPSYLINRFLWTYAYRAAKITLNNTNLFNNINVENLTSLILFYNQDNHRVLNYFIQKKFDHNYLNYKFFYCCLGYGLIPKNNNNIVYYYQHNLIKFKLVLINSLIASNTIKLYCNLYKLNHLLFTKEYNIFINCNYLYK